MGKVNEYIQKLLSRIKSYSYGDKPWLKFYGKLPEHLSYFNGSLYDFLNESAQKNGNRVAIKFYGTNITYKAFMKKIDLIAGSLKKLNIVENECVTICMPNTPESIALIYAVNKIGAIANIVHPLSSTTDIKRAIDETNSSILFASDVSMKAARNIKVEDFIMVPTSESLLGIKKMVYNLKFCRNLDLDEKMMTWADFISVQSTENNYVKRNGDDPAAIIYSGGTTGKPKGIIISNMNFSAMAQQTQSVCEYIRPGYSVLAALPIFHVFGLSVCLHTCLTAGMTLMVLPRIDTKHINRELKKYKPNVLPVVPSLLKMSINDADPGKNAFKDIKIVVCGGDYLPAETRIAMEAFLKEHGSNAQVKAGYGLSEATGFSCCTSIMDDHLDTLGIPNPDMELKIFEPETDVEKEIGELGEICINGPTIMMGYINEDEETKKTLVTHNDGKTWLHTGDIGYMDKEGVFHYTSRLKRMIISNGYNIYPIELEEIMLKCKLVGSCTVVALPHPVKNQVPKAVIVFKKGVEDNNENRNEVKKYAKENIARYAWPSEYEFRSSLPVTAVGKVAYRELENNSKK